MPNSGNAITTTATGTLWGIITVRRVVDASRSKGVAKFTQRLAELTEEQVVRVNKGILEIFRIFIATHTKIRKVVEEIAKNVLAVFRILPRIEDVVMPKLVDCLAWHDRHRFVLEA